MVLDTEGREYALAMQHYNIRNQIAHGTLLPQRIDVTAVAEQFFVIQAADDLIGPCEALDTRSHTSFQLAKSASARPQRTRLSSCRLAVLGVYEQDRVERAWRSCSETRLAIYSSPLACVFRHGCRVSTRVALAGSCTTFAAFYPRFAQHTPFVRHLGHLGTFKRAPTRPLSALFAPDRSDCSHMSGIQKCRCRGTGCRAALRIGRRTHHGLHRDADGPCGRAACFRRCRGCGGEGLAVHFHA